jgi:hypothetical protein
MRVAGVAVAGRNDNGIVLSGSLENWFWPAAGPEAERTITVQDAFNTFVVGS